MVELVTQREYARRRGVSQPAVAKAIKAGRIKTVDGKIDPAQADIQWTRRTQAQAPRGANLAVGGAPPGGNGGNAGSAPGQNGAAHGVDYSQQRAILEGYRARLAKVEYETLTGKLVPIDAVRVKWFNTLRTARQQFEGLAAQLSAMLAAETNQFEVHRILDEAVRRILNDLANANTSTGANAPR